MFNNGSWQTHHHFHVKIKINEKLANRMRRDHFERKEREKNFEEANAVDNVPNDESNSPTADLSEEQKDEKDKPIVVKSVESWADVEEDEDLSLGSLMISKKIIINYFSGIGVQGSKYILL